MPAQQSGKAKVTASLLNVRIGPSTNYKVIGRLPNGSIVDVVGIQEGWSKLKTGGWVSSEYLQEV